VEAEDVAEEVVGEESEVGVEEVSVEVVKVT